MQGLDKILLEGGLRRPQARRGGVSRAELVERACASRSRVVGVTAPAGYGKSTMLAEWAANESRSVAWVSLAQSEDDAAAVLRLLASACAWFSPPAAEVVEDMRGVGGLTLGRAAPLLAAALAATPEPFVLFLDDADALSAPGCRDVLEVMLRGVPEGCQVALAGRTEQAFYARLRAAGDLFEIGVRDLRVDLDGARTIFTDAGLSAVSEDSLAAAWERCEGWPVGLHLSALIVRDGGDASSVSGDDRFIADFLYRECVEHLPDDLQQFLRRTAVLEQLSGEVCDAVLGTTDSRERLAALDERNLFVVPLDRRRVWYRYHALFRAFLLADLQRREGARVADLHLRAASWCEVNGLPNVAIEHLLAAGERARAVRLTATTALSMYQIGQLGVVERWLSALGDDAVLSFPPLATIACWKALLVGDTAEAERLASLLEGMDYHEDGADAARAFDSARAMIRAAMCADGAEQALQDAACAVGIEPVWSSWRDQAVHLLGSALLLTGDVARARAVFAEAAVGTATGNVDSIVLCEAELAILAIDDEDWSTAATHAQQALQIVEANHMDGYATAVLAFGVCARVALKNGDAGAADRLLARGMRARVLCTYVLPFLSIRARLQLAKAYAAKGERVAASALVREMRAILKRRPNLGALPVQVAEYARQLERVPEGAGARPLSPAELRVLPYLQTHLTLDEIGRRLYLSRNTVNSHVRSIYRKLTVSSRSAAVDHATEIGLLGG